MIVMNDFKQELEYLEPAISQTFERVLKSGWYILGTEAKAFESAFAKYCGVKYCVGVGNGMDALQIALLTLGIGHGDEVITTSLSAVATSLAITAAGATPVFVDIDEYYHIDPIEVEKAITYKTKAILPVHLYGQAINIDEIKNIANKHGLKLIEDSCQAHGTKYKGQHVGTFGEVGCFSFYPTKNLGGYGDGGALITNDESIYKQANLLRNYGQETRYTHLVKGLNSRLDEIQAACLSEKLLHLDDFIARRNERAEWYIEALSDVKEVTLPLHRKNAVHSYHLFVIKAKNRDGLMSYLKANGVESIVHYPTPIHKQPCYEEYSQISLPKTERAADSILSLPIHPFITKEEIQTVANIIRDFYAEK